MQGPSQGEEAAQGFLAFGLSDGQTRQSHNHHRHTTMPGVDAQVPTQLLRRTIRIPSGDLSQFFNTTNNNSVDGGSSGIRKTDNVSGQQQHIPPLIAQGMNLSCSMTLSESDMHAAEPSPIKHAKSFCMTTCKGLGEIVAEIRRTLDCKQPALIYENIENLFQLHRNGVRMEMEVCRVPGLALNGLKLRQLAGDALQYKELCQDILATMNL
ncbi:probable serine/threonine-protein kinase MARK-A [Patiria miniata]|nr:probable serine/threonine-protein kinase MARK-A [Patiria miniata]